MDTAQPRPPEFRAAAGDGRLRPLERRALRAAGTLAVEEALKRWQASLAPLGDPGLPALVALLEDWAGFSGLDYPAMLRSIFAGQDKVDQEWHDQRPQTAEEVAAFYDRTDTIIPLLLWWHGTEPGPARGAAAAVAVLTAVGARRVLDFGSGIGSTGLVLAHAGLEVTLADVAREPLSFGAWRMRQRGHEPDTLDLLEHPLEGLSDGAWDGAVAFDVFEHLPETAGTIGRLDQLLRPGAALCFNQAYVPNDPAEPEHYPQHGEVLLQLHALGYRLAHVTDVMWIAQKAPLGGAERRRQALELRARVAAVRAVGDRRRGPVGRSLAFHTSRHGLS